MALSQTGGGLTFDQVVQRRRYRQLSKLGTALVVLLLVLWSIQATVITDTDWARIGGLQSIAKSLGRFLELVWHDRADPDTFSCPMDHFCVASAQTGNK